MLWVRNYDDVLQGWQRQPSLSLSCIKKKQNKTIIKKLTIFCRNTISKIMWKNNWKNGDQSDLMLNVFTIWCTWISEPVVYFL